MAVAALARRDRVRSGQRECRVVVIERGIGPNRCVMTQIALLRESRRSVGWIIRVVVVVQVARDASRARDVIAAELRIVAVGALARRN